LGALKSLLLNEAGTLFRLRFYRNGAHMGFLLATMAQDVDDADVAELAKKVAEAKGLGNFKSMYIHLPDANGKVEVHGIGEFAKDDFEKIKTISRDDIISAHRVPPQILAVLTDNKVPVTGDLDKVIKLYNLNVVEPIQLDIADAVNQHLSEEQRIAFEPYDLPTGAGGAPATPPTQEAGKDALPHLQPRAHAHLPRAVRRGSHQPRAHAALQKPRMRHDFHHPGKPAHGRAKSHEQAPHAGNHGTAGEATAIRSGGRAEIPREPAQRPRAADSGNGQALTGIGSEPRGLRLDRGFRKGAFLPKFGTFRANNAGGRACFVGRRPVIIYTLRVIPPDRGQGAPVGGKQGWHESC
jgi:hypothetical protein